jgi:hypothetical protein
MCCRKIRTHSEWNVQMVGRSGLGRHFGLRTLALRQQLGHAFLHFARGLVGERDAENVSRRDAALDHVRDAEGDDARLARARAGEDQHRAANGFDGLALLRVERGQIQHRARSLICAEANASIPAARVGSSDPVRLGLLQHALPDAAVLRVHVQERRKALNGDSVELSPSDSAAGQSLSPLKGAPQPAIAVSGTKSIRNIVILACFSNHWDDVNNTVYPTNGITDVTAYSNLLDQIGYTTGGASGVAERLLSRSFLRQADGGFDCDTVGPPAA